MHPILFQAGSFTVYSYGFTAAAAVLVSWWIAKKRAVYFGLDPVFASDFLFLLFAAGLIGARLFYVFQHWEIYRSNAWMIVKIQEGGLVWYGGLFAALAAGVFWARVQRQSLPQLADFFSPLIALGQAIGRLGCFLNGCCYGRTTVCVLGVRFPGEELARHPVQLYEAALLFLLSIFLFKAANGRTGRVFTFYVLGVGLIRFGVEFFRGDQILIGIFTLPQWISLVLIAVSFSLIVVFRGDRKTHG